MGFPGPRGILPGPSAPERKSMKPAKPAADPRPPVTETKGNLHPRNPHSGRYDLAALAAKCPDLARFLRKNPDGEATVDFTDPEAVRTLNRALLEQFYGITHWDLPQGYLCPPIPGRADYIHNLADLLGSCNGDVIPRGPSVRILDVGVGASAIYPLIGHHVYGWNFLGTETDPVAASSATNIVRANHLTPFIEIRPQPAPKAIFKALLKPGELFDATMCNPPFHVSIEEARKSSERKWTNLGNPSKSLRNFGGQDAELWCPGGEGGFVGRMVAESVAVGSSCLWFTTLISRESRLDGVYKAIEKAAAKEHRTVEVAQGQKKSRIVAWTFFDEAGRQEWRVKRWPTPSPGAGGVRAPRAKPR